MGRAVSVFAKLLLVLSLSTPLAGCRPASNEATPPPAPPITPITLTHRVTRQPVAVIYAPSLSGVKYQDGNLEYADLRGKDFSKADLRRTNLASADLHGATLARANLQEVNLVAADLTNANLKGADLTRAELSGARLEHADLTGAKLEGAILMGTRYDRRTRWPKGFDPRAHNAIPDR